MLADFTATHWLLLCACVQQLLKVSLPNANLLQICVWKWDSSCANLLQICTAAAPCLMFNQWKCVVWCSSIRNSLKMLALLTQRCYITCYIDIRCIAQSQCVHRVDMSLRSLFALFKTRQPILMWCVSCDYILPLHTLLSTWKYRIAADYQHVLPFDVG